jgi:hypothetical protein
MAIVTFRRFVLMYFFAAVASVGGSTALAQHHSHTHSHAHAHHPSHGGRHYGGYSGTSFSLSIGGYRPFGFGYSDYGYGGLGYDAFGYPGPGYGYGGLGGVGYNNYGLSSYGLGLTSGLGIGRFDYSNPYSSAYRGYYGGYSPYYRSSRSSIGISVYANPSAGYVPTDDYYPSYRNNAPSTKDYGVPGYNSEFSHQSSGAYDRRFSGGRFDETYPNSGAATGSTTGDLRPGMVLPDGSTVVSVEPLGSSPTISTETKEPQSTEPARRGEL